MPETYALTYDLDGQKHLQVIGFHVKPCQPRFAQNLFAVTPLLERCHPIMTAVNGQLEDDICYELGELAQRELEADFIKP